MRSHSQPHWSAQRFRENVEFKRERHLTDAVALRSQTGKWEQIVVAGSSGESACRSRRGSQLRHSAASFHPLFRQGWRTWRPIAKKAKSLLTKAQLVCSADQDAPVRLQGRSEFQATRNSDGS